MARRQNDHVVVIEALGKVALVERLFQEVGQSALVIATEGHLYDLPKETIGIDLDSFEILAMDRRKPERFDRVANAIKGAQLITVMTDDDVEGEVIAHEVWSLVPPGAQARRVRLRQLTSDALVAALHLSEPCPEAHRVKTGLSRRITDRLIGFGLQEGVIRSAIGRVITPLITSLDQERPKAGFVEVTLPANRHEAPWRIHIPYRAGSQREAQNLAQHLSGLPDPEVQVIASTRSPLQGRPHNMGSALIECAASTDSPLKDIEASLQRLYMDGRMTYPRTASRSLGRESARVAQAMAGRFGVADFSTSQLPTEQDPESAHEGLSPTEAVDWQSLALSDSLEDRCLSIVARACVEAGQPQLLHRDTGRLTLSPRNDPWREALRRWTGPVIVSKTWITNPPYLDAKMQGEDGPISARSQPGYAQGSVSLHKDPLEIIALKRMLELGLGQPSTLTHTASECARRFMTVEGRINGLAQQALALARKKAPMLMDIDRIRALERAFDSDRESAVADRVASALHAASIRMPETGRPEKGPAQSAPIYEKLI